MTFLEIIRLLMRYSGQILGTALILATLVFFSTKNDKKKYSTHALLNTGLISGYNIESNKSNRIDYAFTNNEMENLINLASSFETQKELSARLLARTLVLFRDDRLSLHKENQEDFEKCIEQLPRFSNRISEDSLYQQIVGLRDQDMNNPVYQLINSKDVFFGLDQLEQIMVRREGKSDMIRMEYTGVDPFMSQLTLELLIDIFIKKQKRIKEGQTDNVIEFFEEATRKTSARLKQAEDELLNFSVDNKIINYYEQTRFIAGNKEELDKQYQREKQQLAGATSALNRVEMEIGEKDVLPLLQEELANQRYHLSENRNELSSYDLMLRTEMAGELGYTKANLSNRIDSLKNEMSKVTERIIEVSQTPDGIATKELLNQWLVNTIAKEDASAKIEVMEDQLAQFGTVYDRFAPLGSTLKRLEREIDVAEREYLENLHSYNQARLHKYNMLMSSNLKVIDAPYYPAQPEKSKRMLLVILAFIVGLVLPIGLIIALELMDSTMKNPENASLQTRLPFVGLLPKTPKNIENQSIDFKSLNRQALNLFLQQLRAASIGGKQPKEVILFSMHPGEGKSYLLKGLEELTEGEFQFNELPAILHTGYTEEQIKAGDIHVLVASSRRQWTTSDRHALKVYRKLAGTKPLLFLNGVSTYVIEDVIGEIPRKRSWVRRTIKGFLFQGIKKEVWS